MSNSRCRQPEAGSRRCTLPENNPPHFFKIVHSSTVEKQKLKIPPKFVRKHGENLSNTMFLKVPNGEAVWRVESEKSENGEVWFDRGWQDFADFYSIKFGHFLVFKLEGKSLFCVIIFDRTASEIEYPFLNVNIDDDFDGDGNELKVPKMEESEDDDDDDDDVSVEILEKFPCSQTRKEKRAKTKIHDNCQLALHSQSYSIADRVKLKAAISNGGMFATHSHSHQRPKVQERGELIALERAKAFKSKNPFFIVTMHPSYVSPNFGLSIPVAFVKRYFTKKNVLLRVSDDNKTWSTICYLGLYNSYLKTAGWKAFAQDNRLRVGDVCVFELLEEEENLLKVVIFRAN